VKALLQRVSGAAVHIDGVERGRIGTGLVVFLGLDREDDRAVADKLLRKVLGYRVFPDREGRMNRSVADIGGGVLLISQFTLSADTARGLRPGFSSAMAPDEARDLFAYCLERVREWHQDVATGEFGADMQIELVNDGPVTFLLHVNDT